MARKTQAATTNTALADNPLEGEQLFMDAMFGQPAGSQQVATGQQVATSRQTARSNLRPPQPVKRPPASKPQHYKIVSISLYNEDIERLERMVNQLKARGHYKANKSQLIRQALAQLDLDAVPREL